MSAEGNGEQGIENGGATLDPSHIPHEEGTPPIGGSWPRLYAVVLGELALLVALFYWFTKVYE